MNKEGRHFYAMKELSQALRVNLCLCSEMLIPVDVRIDMQSCVGRCNILSPHLSPHPIILLRRSGPPPGQSAISMEAEVNYFLHPNRSCLCCVRSLCCWWRVEWKGMISPNCKPWQLDAMILLLMIHKPKWKNHGLNQFHLMF